MNKKGKVFVGMSGGVDSSVAAALLKKQGYDVVGVHLKCFNVDGCAERDAEDARRAAEHLDIPFYTFDYEDEYKKRVVDYMVAGYKRGITPNPDVMCNKEIKFGLFYDKAMELGADFVATGHYVRVIRGASVATGRSFAPAANAALLSRRVFGRGNDRAKQTHLRELAHEAPRITAMLAVARDSNKDQSYFLWAIKPEHLEKCLFPIGEYKKPQVRKLAEKFGLHNALKKDSQGICFLGQVDLPEFLKKYIKPKKGPIVIASKHSNILENVGMLRGNPTKKFIQIGTHNGAHFFTIGQRHGIGVGGTEKPLYVADKDVKKNLVVVAEGEDHPALYKKQITLSEVNLLNQELRSKKHGKISVMARVRYRQPVFPATLVIHDSSFVLQFKKPVKFVAAGQSAVFYDKKGAMLGGGVIL